MRAWVCIYAAVALDFLNRDRLPHSLSAGDSRHTSLQRVELYECFKPMLLDNLPVTQEAAGPSPVAPQNLRNHRSVLDE